MFTATLTLDTDNIQTGVIRFSVLVILSACTMAFSPSTSSFFPIRLHPSLVPFDWQIVNYNYYYSLNAWLLLCPWWLCFDWSMGCVPLIKSAGDWRIIAVLLLWSCLVGLMSQALCSQDAVKRR